MRRQRRGFSARGRTSAGRRKSASRKLMFELLEHRQLLAANILVVSDPASAQQQPTEDALLNCLIAGGHTIDADSGPFITGPPTAAQLADVDVILVSRTLTSGNYIDGVNEAQAWNALGKPLILMS